MAQHIVKESGSFIHKITGAFKKIECAIENYDKKSLLPEMESAMEFANTLQGSAQVKLNVIKSEVQTAKTEIEQSTLIKHHLLESEKMLKEGLGAIRLKSNFTIFLDGIDTRPSSIPEGEFRECLKGLEEAMWQINTDFFQNIRDSQGRMRFCMLIRPDIYDNLEIYNSNSKLNDNAIMLNWATTEDDYTGSPLYQTVDKYFYGQNEKKEGWDKYFPTKSYKAKSYVFVELLKRSFVRPRDYFTAIKMLRQKHVDNNSHETAFKNSELTEAQFERFYTDYLLGEVKNHSNYYMSSKDFEEYIAFFQYLNGKPRFSYDEYCKAYNCFKAYAEGRTIENRAFYKSEIDLLQFFYDLHVIGYIDKTEDGNNHYHWSYRERTPSKLSPKVRPNAEYIVMQGIRKSLDLGKKYK